MAFQKKESTASEVFTLTLPLHCEPWQRDRLDKLFQCCNNIKNALISRKLKALKQLERRRDWRALQAEIASIYAGVPSKEKLTREQKKALKPLFEKRNAMLKERGFDKYAFEAAIKNMAKHYGDLINSQVAQKLAYSVWDAFDDYLYDNGKQISFSPIGEFTTIEGKSNGTGLRYIDGFFVYKPLKLKIPVSFSRKDKYAYEEQCMQRPIHFCRLMRKWYPEGWWYFLQLILGGKPPRKIRREDGNFKQKLGSGRVGLDIGTQTLAVTSDSAVQMHILAEKVQSIEDELQRLNRAMELSRRATNPEMFHADGTIVTIDKLPEECIIHRKTYKKRKWVKSNRYRELEAYRKHLYRKQTEARVQMHHELANQLLPLGDTFYIEDMNYKALAKKAKEAKKNKKGKWQSRKRFGKSIANKAPATFVKILEKKVQRLGGTFERVSTFDTKASQFDHIDHTFKKAKLSNRWKTLADGTRVQRDLYSAFLLQCLNDTLDGYDETYIQTHFSNFKTLHDIEIQRLTTVDAPSSVGVRKVS